jgi:hypothetical protein
VGDAVRPHQTAASPSTGSQHSLRGQAVRDVRGERQRYLRPYILPPFALLGKEDVGTMLLQCHYYTFDWLPNSTVSRVISSSRRSSCRSNSTCMICPSIGR